MNKFSIGIVIQILSCISIAVGLILSFTMGYSVFTQWWASLHFWLSVLGICVGQVFITEEKLNKL